MRQSTDPDYFSFKEDLLNSLRSGASSALSWAHEIYDPFSWRINYASILEMCIDHECAKHEFCWASISSIDTDLLLWWLFTWHTVEMVIEFVVLHLPYDAVYTCHPKLYSSRQNLVKICSADWFSNLARDWLGHIERWCGWWGLSVFMNVWTRPILVASIFTLTV